MEEDHASTCQQGVLVSLHELNMVNLYWETTVYYQTLQQMTTDARPPNYHCDCGQTSPVCPHQGGGAEGGDGGPAG